MEGGGMREGKPSDAFEKGSHSHVYFDTVTRVETLASARNSVPSDLPGLGIVESTRSLTLRSERERSKPL